MARLWSSGFELNTLTSAVEFDSTTGSGLTIQTSVVRSGTYAAKILIGGSASLHRILHTDSSSAQTGPRFVRFYFRVDDFPDSTDEIFAINNGRIKLTSAGKLQLFNGASQIGSDSSALSLNTWYRIEIQFDSSAANGSHILNACIDGSQFAGSSSLTLGTFTDITWGSNLLGSGAINLTYYFDDLAVNDSTGAAQTSYPGSGSIVHIRPNGDGDNHGWKKQDGSAGDANNYQKVNEITPDDATSYVERINTGTITDDYACDDSGTAGIGSTATVTLVQVGLRAGATSNTAGNRSGILRIKSQAAGTVLSSSAFSWATTGWFTHTLSGPRTYQLTSYTDPQAGGAWTPALLDTMQIGVQNGVSSTQEIRLSALWALVEYVPGSGNSYSSTLSETITFTDSLIRQANKVLLETITHTDTLLRQATKVLSETITHTDTLLKQAARALIETITHTDTFASIKLILATLSESLTLSDDVSKLTGKNLSEAITHDDTLTKQTAKPLAESVTLTDVLSRLIGKVVSETVSFVDSLVEKVTGKTLTETITHTDDIIKSTVKTAFTETLTFTDSILKQTSRILSETITHTDTLITKIAAKILAETVTFTDSLIRQIAREFAETITLADTILRQAGKLLSDTITYTDTFASKITGKILTETVSLTDSIVKAIARVLSETFTLADSLFRISGKIFSETITHIDSLSFTKVFGRILTETISFTDTLKKTIGKVLTETISLIDKLKSYLNGVLSIYKDKYLIQHTSFNDKNSSRGTSYADKNSTRNTSYTDKNSPRSTPYSDKNSSRGTNYHDTYQ